jgi:hypothetical protein
LGVWKKQKKCLLVKDKSLVHRTDVKSKTVGYCDNCSMNFAVQAALYGYGGEKPSYKKLDRYEKFKNKQIDYYLTNLLDKPGVRMFVKFQNGDEQYL